MTLTKENWPAIRADLEYYLKAHNCNPATTRVQEISVREIQLFLRCVEERLLLGQL